MALRRLLALDRVVGQGGAFLANDDLFIVSWSTILKMDNLID